MSLLGNILEKLGIKKPAAGKPAPPAAKEPLPAPTGKPAQSVGPAPIAKPRPVAKPAPTAKPGPAMPADLQSILAAHAPSAKPAAPAAPTSPAPQAVPAAAAPTPMPMVDVVSKLEQLAAGSSYPLDWKVSIVDLLKLLGIDSSYASRKELAVELGCPAEKMGDSAQMNVWLHKTVLQKIAENGGNVPKELLD